MAGHEIMLGFEYLQSTLSGDATLASYAPGGVWRSLAPPSSAAPFVIVSHQASVDKLTMNAIRLWSEVVYQVKAVGPGNAAMIAQLVSAAAEIDALLKRPPVTTTTDGKGGILACYREQALELDELVDGELWTNIGGLYRLQIQQIA